MTLEISLLDMEPKEIESVGWKDICTLTFIAELFTVANMISLIIYQWMHGW